MTLLMTRKGRRVAVAGMSFMVTLVTRLLAAVRMTDHWKMSRATPGLNTTAAGAVVLLLVTTVTTAAPHRTVASQHPGASSLRNSDGRDGGLR